MENLALKYQDVKNTVKNIQNTDRNLLKDTIMITKVDEVIKLMDYFNSQKTVINADVQRLDQNLCTLHSILEQRIALTAEVMGIRQSLLIPTPEDTRTINAIRADIGKSEEIAVEKVDNTINATELFIAAAQKESVEPVNQVSEVIETPKTNVTVYEDENVRSVEGPNFREVILKNVKMITETPEVVKDNSVIGLTLETLQNECLHMLEEKGYSEVHQYFRDEISNVTDLTDDQKRVFGKYWGAVCAKHKDTLRENKEKENTVDAAEKAAIEGKDKIEEVITESQVRSKVMDIIKEKGSKALNDVQKFLSSNTIRKVLNGKKASEYYKEVKKEFEESNVISSEEMFTPVTKHINISESYVDVAESAVLCKDINELKSLIETIVYEKNKELGKEAFPVAYNVAMQYTNKIAGHEEWSDKVKQQWFIDVIRNHKKQETITVEEEKTQPESTVASVEEVHQEPIAESTEKTDFGYISKETKGNRVKQGAIAALKAGMSDDEVISLMKASKPYKGARPEEMKNVLTGLKEKLK